jgi:hypothetical protein
MQIAFRALLLTIPQVAALGASRVNWWLHPQGKPFPALVLNKISGREWMHMNGPNGVYDARIQVDTYADTYAAAQAISTAIHDFLHCYRGGGFRFIQSENENARFEGGSNEADYPFRASEDFTITWRPI